MPTVTDPGTISQKASYAPPTSEVGQGGAFSGAENDTAVGDMYNRTDAAGYNSYHQAPTSGQRGGAD